MQDIPSGDAKASSATCKRIAPELAAFHDGMLAAKRQRQIAAHVVGCAWCAAQLRQLAEMDARLRAAPAPAVPAVVRLRLAQRIRAAQSSVPVANILRPRSREDFPHMTSETPSKRIVPPQPRIAVATIAAVLVVVLAFAVFHSLPRNGNRAGTGPATSAPSVASGNWQAAYLGGDNHLHFVSAQGHDSTGPALSDTNFFAVPSPLPNTSVSSDGRYLAYIALGHSGPLSVKIYDMVTKQFSTFNVLSDALYWAPNRPVLLANTVGGVDVQYPDQSSTMTIIDMQQHTQRLVKLTERGQSIWEDRFLGWSDDTHVVALTQKPTSGLQNATFAAQTPLTSQMPASHGPYTLGIDTIDITSGNAHHIAATTSQASAPFLSPDGKEMFLAPTDLDASARVIDVATGHIHQLPTIAAAFAGQLKSLDGDYAQSGNWAIHFAWQPGTHVLIVSLSGASIPNEGAPPASAQQDAGLWSIDVDADQATRLDHRHYPLSWIPGTSALFASDIPTLPNGTTNSGYLVGTKLVVFAPVTASGKAQTVATGMQAYFGLVQLP